MKSGGLDWMQCVQCNQSASAFRKMLGKAMHSLAFCLLFFFHRRSSLCTICERFGDIEGILSCEAFPFGIPEAIYPRGCALRSPRFWSAIEGSDVARSDELLRRR